MCFEKEILWAALIISLIINMIYLISVYKESYKKSFEDVLTEVYNRKFLEDEVHKFVEIGNDKYQVIFCDIDHFKKINDTYGHDVGDEVLKIIGRKLKQKFKEGKDYIIRYGGEEFLILIKTTEEQIKEEEKISIINRIEDLRKSIEESNFKIKDENINITMSFGICFYQKDMNLKEQIKEADELLYVSKETGRNKVTIK